MKIQVDGVLKNQREYFKEKILQIISGNVYFTMDIAIIELKGAYIPTIESIQKLNNQQKAIRKFLKEFRLYQFNLK